MTEIESGPFAGLTDKGYDLIVADPPWRFNVRSEKGLGRSAENHYQTMKLPEIAALPVADLAMKDCVLLLWVTDPLLDRGLEVMKAWGFAYKTVGFYWTKTNRDGSPFMGTGYWTRANPEQCLLGVRGKPKRLDASVPRWITSPRREHSRKPDEFFDRARRLTGSSHLELFSRQQRAGWTCWGNQTERFPGVFVDPLATYLRALGYRV